MSRKAEIFENVLTNPYDNGVFVNFVQEFLNNVELVAPSSYKKVYNNFSYYVDGYTILVIIQEMTVIKSQFFLLLFGEGIAWKEPEPCKEILLSPCLKTACVRVL